MARIRTIKPEFWGHPKVTSVSRDARLLFIGLLNEADDEGRMRYSLKRISGVVFPNDDDVDCADIHRWMDELERVGLILRYEVNGAALLLLPGFTEHQKINRPSPSRLPDPHGVLTEGSLMDHGGFTAGTGNREEESDATAGLLTKKRSYSPTEEFTPTDKHYDYAREHGLTVDDELAHWLDWCEANGRTYKNLNAGFSTWLRQAVGFGRGGLPVASLDEIVDEPKLVLPPARAEVCPVCESSLLAHRGGVPCPS